MLEEEGKKIGLQPSIIRYCTRNIQEPGFLPSVGLARKKTKSARLQIAVLACSQVGRAYGRSGCLAKVHLLPALSFRAVATR